MFGFFMSSMTLFQSPFGVSYMALSPYVDLSLGYLLDFFMGGLIAFACVVLLEAFILLGMSWRGVLNTLRDSFLVNLITTIMSVILFLVSGPLIYKLGYILAMILLWYLTLLIEGSLFYLLSNHSFTQALLSSTAANICSYLLV
jgi:hypothetical protein